MAWVKLWTPYPDELVANALMCHFLFGTTFIGFNDNQNHIFPFGLITETSFNLTQLIETKSTIYVHRAMRVIKTVVPRCIMVH